MADDDGFLSRWARRKEQAKQGVVVAEPVLVEPLRPTPLQTMPAQLSPALPVDVPVAAPVERHAAASDHQPVAEPLPTMDDVALLTRESDYSRFVTPGIDEGVKQAAMKKLFTDPHFNVMDGLDTYIDDYSQPDPIPLAMLRQMNQSWTLGLFDHEKEDAQRIGPPAATTVVSSGMDTASDAETATEAAPDTEPLAPPDDHADLRLQQDHAGGRPGPDQGAGA